MDRRALCLTQIQAIRDVADGEAPPYVARSRIGRLAISVAGLTSELAGVDAPRISNRIDMPPHATYEIKALVNSSNRLLELAKHVSQPSEPLDTRWQRTWDQLLEELVELESYLNKIDHG